MNVKGSKTGAFTLIEVIVGMVVVTIIGFAAWRAVNVLSPSTLATEYRIKAEHLITLSEEELRHYAQSQPNFDNKIKNCNFEQPDNICGFPDVSAQFPGFSIPTLTYIKADSKLDLKKFNIHVSWQEMGQLQVKDAVVLLARPPNPLPGNIYGLVTSTASPNTPLYGVTITAQNLDSANTTAIQISQAAASPPFSGGIDGYNYNFANPYFSLAPGRWQLSATKAGYIAIPNIQIVTISGSDNHEIDFQITPQPTATITAKVPSPYFTNSNSAVYLYKKGSPPPSSLVPTYYYSGYYNPAGNTFTVTFPDTNMQCFTLFTWNAYYSKLAGNFVCPPYPYQYNGWSSAQADAGNNVLNCGANWWGDLTGDTDNICVKPGDAKVVNIPLVPVPTATVPVINVVDSTGAAIPATAANPVLISVYWNNGTVLYSQISESLPGPYSNIAVPAEQDLFPALYPTYSVLIKSTWNVPMPQCCNQNINVLTNAQQYVVGPLHGGGTTAPVTVTLNTTTTPANCGNADGLVSDAKTNALLSGATVTLAGVYQSTNGIGQFTYQCAGTPAPPPYDVPVGVDTITASEPGYYPFSSAGNNYYTATGGDNVAASTLTHLGTIDLWPIGYTTISGRVVENVNGVDFGVAGVPVVLRQWNGVNLTTTTQGDGSYVFNNPNTVLETWPPTALIGNAAYNQTPRLDILSITATSSYSAYTSTAFPLTAGTPYNVPDIVLTPPGGA